MGSGSEDVFFVPLVTCYVFSHGLTCVSWFIFHSKNTFCLNKYYWLVPYSIAFSYTCHSMLILDIKSLSTPITSLCNCHVIMFHCAPIIHWKASISKASQSQPMMGEDYKYYLIDKQSPWGCLTYSLVCVHRSWLDELGYCPQMTELHMVTISLFWACRHDQLRPCRPFYYVLWLYVKHPKVDSLSIR